MDNRRLLGMVSTVYEAVADTSAWQAFVEDVVDFFGADAGDMVTEDDRNRTLLDYGTVGYEDEFRELYETEFEGANIWSETARRFQLLGPACSENEYVPRPEFIASKFFNEWMRPQGGLRYGIGLVLENDGRYFTNLGLMRANSGRAYGQRDAEQLAPLMPHLQRAIALRRRIDTLEQNYDTALATMERCALPVVILGRGARVIHLTRPAATLLNVDRTGLELAGERVRATTHDDDKRLKAAIRGAFAFDAAAYSAKDSFVVVRGAGGRTLGVLVTPVPQRTLGFEDSLWRVALVLLDPEQNVNVREEWLRQMFLLTPTEARVATAIASGQAIDEYAVASNITLGTARWHLKNLLAKSGAPRQADLVRRLHNTLRFS